MIFVLIISINFLVIYTPLILGDNFNNITTTNSISDSTSDKNLFRNLDNSKSDSNTASQTTIQNDQSANKFDNNFENGISLSPGQSTNGGSDQSINDVHNIENSVGKQSNSNSQFLQCFEGDNNVHSCNNNFDKNKINGESSKINNSFYTINEKDNTKSQGEEQPQNIQSLSNFESNLSPVNSMNQNLKNHESIQHHQLTSSVPYYGILNGSVSIHSISPDRYIPSPLINNAQTVNQLNSAKTSSQCVAGILTGPACNTTTNRANANSGSNVVGQTVGGGYGGLVSNGGTNVLGQSINQQNTAYDTLAKCKDGLLSTAICKDAITQYNVNKGSNTAGQTADGGTGTGVTGETNTANQAIGQSNTNQQFAQCVGSRDISGVCNNSGNNANPLSLLNPSQLTPQMLVSELSIASQLFGLNSNQKENSQNDGNNNNLQSQGISSDSFSSSPVTANTGESNIHTQKTTGNVNITNNREKLIDKVSSEGDLNTILNKFKNFIETPSSDIHTPHTMVISNTSAYNNIYYLINPHLLNPQQIIKENYSVLMFKFADSNNNNIENTINYKIKITNPIDNSIVLERLSSTSNTADLQVIDENTFSRGDVNNPVYYQMWIDILSINGQNVNEHTKLSIPLKVI